MGFYLHQFTIYAHIRANIEGIAKEFKVSISPYVSGPGNMTTTVELVKQGYGRITYLSEFPGNCSSLILSHIQSVFYDSRDAAVNFIECALRIARAGSYGALIITTTDPELVEFLEKNYQFKGVTFFTNPHTAANNFFMFRYI